jgi:hypothetical protein
MARNKLGLVEGGTLVLLDAPTELALEVPTGVTVLERGKAQVVIAFVPQRAAVAPAVKVARARVEDTGKLWFAYPKAGQLATDLHRDLLGTALSELGFEPIALVSIDDVWSAMQVKVDIGLAARRAARGFVVTSSTDDDDDDAAPEAEAAPAPAPVKAAPAKPAAAKPAKAPAKAAKPPRNAT